MPDFGAFNQRWDWLEHAHVQFSAGIASEIVVHHSDIVAAV
jgi:hypothetical protein